jgi:hypothetical protein
MTRALPRAHFTSSRLTRFLTEYALLEAAPARVDIGQKLGDWLNFRQAIDLHALLNPEQHPAAPQPVELTRAGLTTAMAMTRHVDKVRTQLEQAILLSAPNGSGLTRIDMPPAELDEPIEPKTAYEPYRRFYAAHQRQMAAALQSLRAQVRGQLSKNAPRLQQLTQLDAAFENILSEREAVLLGQVAKLFERRFAQALKQHLKTEAAAPDEVSDGSTATQLSPRTWLLTLRQAMRTALLAELDTRLQPVLGLLEAWHAYTHQEQ